MKLTQYQAFHLSLQLNHMLMPVSDFKAIAKTHYCTGVEDSDFTDATRTTLIDVERQELIDLTQSDWDNMKNDIKLYPDLDAIEYADETKLTETLINSLHADPFIESELTNLELEGINIVSGAQLMDDIRAHSTLTDKFAPHWIEQFKKQIDYKPHGIYVWSERVEEAVNVNHMSLTTLETIGISDYMYLKLDEINKLM